MSFDLTRANLSNLSWSLDDEGMLVELAAARGWVTEAQLDECRREQRATDPPSSSLGLTLVARGLLTADQLAQLRSEQARLKDEARAAARVLPSGLPRQIGRYRLLEILGEGGMGLVFRARDEQSGQDVALKMLKTVQAFNPAQAERFERETRTAGRLSHAGIVKVLDVGRHGDVPFYTMELVTGRPLSEVGGDLGDRVRILEKVVRAVQHAHERSVVHRDLKPQNIIVDEKGEPHLLDFGLSRDLVATHDLTRSGALLGTPFYMAPEQAGGRVHEIDARTDVYALGVVLYEMMAARPPFEGADAAELTRRILTDDPRRPPGPKDLVTICLKAIEKNPARRYASAAALADDLARYLSGAPIQARTPSVLYRLRRSSSRHRLRIVAAASIAIALGALAISLRPPQVQTAILDSTEGEVYVLDASGRGPARAGTRIVSGQGVETAGPAARAALRYEDGTRVDLEGSARLRLNASPPGKNLYLEQGRLRVLVAPQPDAQPFGLSSRKAELKTREGEFIVTATPEWTRLETTRGSVRLTRLGDGASADVAAGRYAVAESGVEVAARGMPPVDRVPREGLYLWLRADEGIEVTGGRVSRWEDQSGHEHHAVQDVVARRPLIRKDVVGGKPALQLDEGRWLAVKPGFLDFGRGVSVFVLARPASAKPVLLELGSLEGGSGAPLGVFRLRCVANQLTYETDGTSGGGKKATLDAPGGTAHGHFQSFGLVQDGSGLGTLYRNGVALAGGKLPLPAPPNRGRNAIGEDAGPYEFRGDLAEVLVYDRALGDTERRDVERYLFEKYLEPSLGPATRGLSAEYFSKEDLSGPSVRRVDPRVDFEWHDAPELSISKYARFSARWTGILEARSDEPFTLHVLTNHRFRLWVEDALVLEGDSGKAVKEWEACVAPRPGRRHRVALESFYTKQPNQTEGRKIVLCWSSPSMPKEVVPQSQFIPSAPNSPK